MRRRDVIAGGAALVVAGGGAAIAMGDWDPLEDDDALPEFELASIEAPGSEAGTVVVPERGSVTFLEVFSTGCSVCQDLMEPLGEVYDAVGDDVQFVSVTNEPLGRTITREDVADWWADYGGRWTVAHDEDIELTGTDGLAVTSVPHSVVLDERNLVTWRDSGYKSADEIREPIDAALAGDSEE